MNHKNEFSCPVAEVFYASSLPGGAIPVNWVSLGQPIDEHLHCPNEGCSDWTLPQYLREPESYPGATIYSVAGEIIKFEIEYTKERMDMLFGDLESAGKGQMCAIKVITGSGVSIIFTKVTAYTFRSFGYRSTDMDTLTVTCVIELPHYGQGGNMAPCIIKKQN